MYNNNTMNNKNSCLKFAFIIYKLNIFHLSFYDYINNDVDMK